MRVRNHRFSFYLLKSLHRGVYSGDVFRLLEDLRNLGVKESLEYEFEVDVEVLETRLGSGGGVCIDNNLSKCVGEFVSNVSQGVARCCKQTPESIDLFL